MTDPNAVDETPLEKSQEAIDEARDAAKKVADAEDIEVGDLPAFSDSAADTEATNAFATGDHDEDGPEGDEEDAEDSDGDDASEESTDESTGEPAEDDR